MSLSNLSAWRNSAAGRRSGEGKAFGNRNRCVAVLGAGLAGCVAALSLARRGYAVDIIDAAPSLITGASLRNEGKLHLGYVYAADPGGLTIGRMIEGTLSFLPILQELTGVQPGHVAHSRPFIYGSPQDSQKSAVELAAHFERVDRAITAADPPDGAYFGARSPHLSRRLEPREFQRWFAPGAMQAAFMTDERSVDVAEIADLVAACILAEENITIRRGCTVRTASPAPGDSWHVSVEEEGRLSVTRYAAVINALWADRLRLDAEIGLDSGRPWLLRYKAALSIDYAGPKCIFDAPSATLILGPYGDFVNHGNGRYYLSWYPVCKLAETRGVDPTPLFEAAERADPKVLAASTLDGLAHVLPFLEALRPTLDRVRVAGGVIAAWGESDIHDPASGLHERHEIGPRRHGTWVTLDTGKYCTAPLYAVRAADMTIEALA